MDLQPVEAFGTERSSLGKHQQGPGHVTAKVVKVRRLGVRTTSKVHIMWKPKDLVPHVVGDRQLIQRVHSEAVHLRHLLLGFDTLSLHVGLLDLSVGRVMRVEARNLRRFRQRGRDAELFAAFVVEYRDDDVQQGLVDLPGTVAHLIEGVQDSMEIFISALLQEKLVLDGSIGGAHQLGGRQQVRAALRGNPGHGWTQHGHDVGFKCKFGFHRNPLDLCHNRMRFDEADLMGMPKRANENQDLTSRHVTKRTLNIKGQLNP